MAACSSRTRGFGARPVIDRVEIPIPHLHEAFDGFRIVQLSDIHLYPYTRIDQVRRAVCLANDLRPDLVVLTGDYISKVADVIFELAPVLAGLDARQGVFSILGNHDVRSDEHIVGRGLAAAGLQLLTNRGVVLTRGKGSLGLAGLDDGCAGHPSLTLALNGIPNPTPVVLLCHEPDLADIYLRSDQVVLQLSGHSHGGQIRLPGIGALFLPRLGRKYDCGLYRVNGKWLYTNRGLGFGSLPIRINCPPEVTEITLRQSDGSVRQT